jgi:hypothetical protein
MIVRLRIEEANERVLVVYARKKADALLSIVNGGAVAGCEGVAS